MGEHPHPREFDPSGINQENVVERSETFLATARSTDAIRSAIKAGDLRRFHSKKVFLSMHKTHIEENPERVYNQEDTPGMNMRINSVRFSSLDEYLEAGEFRTEEAMVGEFSNLPVKELKTVANRFFKRIDALLTHEGFLVTLPKDQKLLILTLIHQMLVLGHFVKNASGRTDEDFLCYIASRLDLPFTISENGFRGQMAEDDFETRVEQAMWIFRNESYDTVSAARLILDTLSMLIDSASANDPRLFDQILLNYEEKLVSVDPILEVFNEATTRTYSFLPPDEETRQLYAEAAAHWALYNAQSYEPQNQNAKRVRAYLEWHIAEMSRLSQMIRTKGTKKFTMMLRQRVMSAKAELTQADEKYSEEEQRRLRASETDEPVSEEELDRLREYFAREIEARRKAEELVRRSLQDRERGE
jgi:hypothetical protein